MENTDLSTAVTIGTGDNQQNITLADIAGVDISAVAANYGFSPTPAGTWHFRCAEATLGAAEYTPKGATEKVTAPCVLFRLEAVNVINLTDPAKAPADYIGWEHQERVFIKQPREDLGRCRALMESAGLTMQGEFVDALRMFVGMEFQAVVTNTKDRNDADKVWANLDLKKVSPLGGGAMVAQVAATGTVAPPAPAPAAPQPQPQVPQAAGMAQGTAPPPPQPQSQPAPPAPAPAAPAPAGGTGFVLNT